MPDQTTISPQTIFAPSRKYRDKSYLSSRVPITSAINAAVSSAITLGERGRKIRLAISIPPKSGMPPPRGIGFV